MMKKLLATMMALVMMLTLSQCKKQNEENEENTAKVRISCTIPINNDDKTDFTNILNGEVNWSAEPERIYLALPYSEENHQIVVLTSTTNTGGKTLTFEGSVKQGLLQNGQHAIWYMGRSQNSKLLDDKVTGSDDKVTGSIAQQSGSKDDLGYHHIAKASVNINVDNGITMTFKGKFESQMAIAHLDLTNVAGLSGEAIVGTDYSLEYIDGVYRLKVTGDKDINITGKENKNESYVVLFPTNAKDVVLNSDSNKKITFRNGIKQNTLYKENDNKPLIWELPEHECVDLGLSVKWATCNIGAGSPEAYGKYYAWGEIEEPLPLPAGGYVPATCGTYNKLMSDISGHETYDAATANWGKDWRIPTKAQCEELMNEEYCTWEWIDNGYLVTSKINGNYIFLPAAGFKSGRTDVINDGGVYGTYSCSTPAERGNDDDAEKSYNLSFKDETKAIGRIYRENGRVVRPVTGGDFESPAAQYAEVTTAEVSEITGYAAVCGGNVTVDKYSDVRERGVYYNTSENLIIENGIKVPSASAASGEYTVELTGLQLNTTYYVRAYATTDAGTSYGEVKSFTTANIGVVTLDVTDITRHSATFNCKVSYASSQNILYMEWGFYYSTSPNPVETGKKYQGNTWCRNHEMNSTTIADLKPNTTYYVKAYAKYESKEYYGEVKSFTTLDYEYVNLGLPSGTLWATHNVGATTPQEQGNSYKWGATEVGGDSYSGYEDISGTQYDAATANWDSGWRMPTREQMNELLTQCTWVKEGTGWEVTGPSGNHIFLPGTEPVHIIEGNYSCYWTSQPISSGSVALRFNDEIHELFIIDKDNACAIRPVRSK